MVLERRKYKETGRKTGVGTTYFWEDSNCTKSKFEKVCLFNYYGRVDHKTFI